MDVRIGNEEVTLGKLIGEGGEARVYRIDDKTLAKIYRMPTDPELADVEVAAARLRVIVAQRKLPLFPRDLPPSIVAPQRLIRETKSNLIVGYTMPFIKDARPLSDFKSASVRQIGVSDSLVIGIFRNLMHAVRAVHARGTIIGDFNDTNVLVTKDTPRIIDADSMQYGPYRSKVFMPAFVDPNRCDPNAKALDLVKSHDAESDWYAWTVMLFQSLFFIHPYGGVHKPAVKTKAVLAGLRGLPQHRISVYDPEVRYPAQARSLDDAPEALTAFFKAVFVQGLRPEPTDALFEGLAFKSDGSFDKSKSVKGLQAKTVKSDRRTQARTILESKGDYLTVSWREGPYPDYVEFTEKKSVLRNGKHLTDLRAAAKLDVQIVGSQTALVRENEAVVFSDGWKQTLKIVTKAVEIANLKQTMLTGSNAGVVYWDGDFKQVVGRTEPAIKTLDIDTDVKPLDMWGSGNLLFVLCVRNGKLGYLVHHMTWDVTLYQHNLPVAKPEQIKWSKCFLNAENAWLFLKHDDGRSTCDVFDRSGKIKTHVESTDDWVVKPETSCLFGGMLFRPSDSGISRVTCESGRINITEFPYLESTEGVKYLIAGEKLFAVCQDKVLELTVT